MTLVEQLTEWFDELDFDRSHDATRNAEYTELMRIVHSVPAQGALSPVAWQAREKVPGGIWRHCDVVTNDPDIEFRPLYLAPQPMTTACSSTVLEALVLAEDVLSRAPFSTAIWPNGMHPQIGIDKIRDAIEEAQDCIITDEIIERAGAAFYAQQEGPLNFTAGMRAAITAVLATQPALTSTERCRYCNEVVEPGHDCSAPSTEPLHVCSEEQP